VFAAGAELLFKSGGLSRLMQLIADTLDQLRATAPGWIVSRLPESADTVQHAMSRWLREHSGEMQRWGAEALKILVHILLGLAIGLMAATAARTVEPAQPRRPLIVLAQARMLQLANAFGDVFSAQLRISLINSALTGIYLLVVLPALGYRVPLAPTLVGFTFFGGLLPIVGNLLSNTAITIAALTVSVWAGRRLAGVPGRSSTSSSTSSTRRSWAGAPTCRPTRCWRRCCCWSRRSGSRGWWQRRSIAPGSRGSCGTGSGSSRRCASATPWAA
jgi:hypothetical protein